MTVTQIKFQSLVQHSFDIISIIDREGNYLYNSDSMTRTLGYSPQELIGINALTYVHPEDIDRLAFNLHRLYNESFINDLAPFRIKNKKGEWKWLEATGTNMLKDPFIKGLLVHSRDVTEKIELQEKLNNYHREITSAAIEAQERERTMLSLELHDNVNQVLTTVKLYLEIYLLKGGDDIRQLQTSIKYIQDCIHEIRSISIRLSAPSLGEISLKDSLKELVDSINLTKRIHIDFKITGINENLISHEMHISLYRLIREQLNNILQHSFAKKAWISIQKTNKCLVLTIRDNGRGFNTEAKSKGIGLMSMESRIESLKGKFSITSSEGNGCTLTASIPLGK